MNSINSPCLFIPSLRGLIAGIGIDACVKIKYQNELKYVYNHFSC